VNQHTTVPTGESRSKHRSRHQSRRHRKVSRKFRAALTLVVGIITIGVDSLFFIKDAELRRPDDEFSAGDPLTIYFFWGIALGVIAAFCFLGAWAQYQKSDRW
jgi:O-antigen/teichoic acid export membrane protein